MSEAQLAAGALMVPGWLCLCGCERLVLVVHVELGIAAAEERAVVDVIDDLTVRIALDHGRPSAG